ncbi:hypothetical protein LXA43DRAFT_1051604 [Ganoderma leucocontextum]|nr:hypothetical protein LXA43DRAFT_1051604 [Ganoderma leucocontextum]
MMSTPHATPTDITTFATHLCSREDIPIDPALLSDTVVVAHTVSHPGDRVSESLCEGPNSGRPPDVHGDPPAICIQSEAPREPPLTSIGVGAAQGGMGDAGIMPLVRASGKRVQRHDFERFLVETFKRKECLLQACAFYNLRAPKSATLSTLRSKIVDHWYPKASQTAPRAVPPSPQPLPSSSPQSDFRRRNSRPVRDMSLGVFGHSEQDDEDEDALVARYDIEGAAAAELLEYDHDGLDAEDEELDDDTVDSDEAFKRFQVKTRVDAVKRFEENRRAGGRKTQQANEKSWNLFICAALEKGHVQNNIVDEHALLLYINHTAGRPQRNRRGKDIPGTRVGASQIKKEFFGALRIRKKQEAQDPTLATSRPVTTVAVYDLLKTCMNEALQRAPLGLIPAQDAPDIIANTFLGHITDEQRARIRVGFLQHRELHSTLKGFLAWTLCSASGKRGDDIRALKLCEIQPYILIHPNNLTKIPAILGLQAEDKAGQRGMQTTVNPRYICWIAHRNPLQCPFGALAFLLHFLYDQYGLGEKLDIKWDINKSWRQIRLIFGSSLNCPYNEHNLYNLYCQAFKKADFESGIKAHLPRHELGYLQEQLGVDGSETARLGWSRDTYTDVYAPSLPKKAILACHGYMEHEEYSPTRCKVPVPPTFLARVCPMAEEVVASIDGKAGLVGATNHWRMVVSLRPHLFLCAAAIYQVAPDSSIFQLPALAHDDVKQWMKSEYPSQLAALEAKEGDPISLECLQNTMVRQSLQHLTLTIQRQADEMARLQTIVNRRTAAFSPPKGFVGPGVAPNGGLGGLSASYAGGIMLDFGQGSSDGTPTAGPLMVGEEDTGVYEVNDNSLRAFVASSPTLVILARPRTEVDLVLPPAAAFTPRGQCLQLPDFGTGSVTWQKVFQKVVDPAYLWDVWKPEKTLEQSSIEDLWESYNIGTTVKDAEGNPIGSKPPLRLVEQHFRSSWRKTAKARKTWQRYREIPEWIDGVIQAERITPIDAIARLQEKRQVPGSSVLRGISSLTQDLAGERKATSVTPVLNGSSSLVSSSRATSPVSASPHPVSEPSSLQLGSLSTGEKRKRAPAVGARTQKRKRTRTATTRTQ